MKTQEQEEQEDYGEGEELAVVIDRSKDREGSKLKIRDAFKICQNQAFIQTYLFHLYYWAALSWKANSRERNC